MIINKQAKLQPSNKNALKTQTPQTQITSVFSVDARKKCIPGELNIGTQGFTGYMHCSA